MFPFNMVILTCTYSCFLKWETNELMIAVCQELHTSLLAPRGHVTCKAIIFHMWQLKMSGLQNIFYLLIGHASPSSDSVLILTPYQFPYALTAPK